PTQGVQRGVVRLQGHRREPRGAGRGKGDRFVRGDDQARQGVQHRQRVDAVGEGAAQHLQARRVSVAAAAGAGSAAGGHAVKRWATCWMLLLAACASGTTSERRESRAPSERIEAPGTGEQVPADTSSGTARNRDRDPEAEKRKMAESRARSEQAVKMLRLGRLADAVASSRAALKVHEQNVEAMLVLAEVFYRQ